MTEIIPKRILIDTDLGDDVDDAAALIMALNSPELEIVGITTVYLDTVKRAEMVLELCGKCGRSNIPVCAGFSRPLIERPNPRTAPIQYEILEMSRKEQIITDCDGAEFIIRKVKEYPDVTIIAIGCMTNLGIAFYREPELMKQVNIIAMGGVFTSSFPEWNIKCDPEAARMVMDYAGHLKMFGLEVTKHCLVPDERMETLCASQNERMRYFKRGIRIFREKTGFVYTFHDALLIAYLLDEKVCGMEQSDFTVELSGCHTRGAIVFHTNAYDLHTSTQKDFYYAASINVERFRELIKERFF